MLPTEWGPTIWYNFHTMSYTFNTDKRENYIKFFKSMAYILPCNTCSEHFKKNLANSTPEKNTVDRETMVKWLINMHNSVNIRLKKKIVSYSMAKKIYYDNSNNLVVNHNKILKFVRIMKKYLSTGISSIVLYHGGNVIINYCYFCPCLLCREKLVLLASESKKYDLKVFVDKMIDIIRGCGVESVSRENISIQTFLPHKKIYKIMTNGKLKIIVKQDGSTPGIRRRIRFEPKVNYEINVDLTYGEDVRPFLWIRNVRTNEVIRKDELKNVRYEGDGDVDMGIFLHSPKMNDIFYLNEFRVSKV